MKCSFLFIVFSFSVCLQARAQEGSSERGAPIYNKGRNAAGVQMLDRKASTITIIRSCRGCHGRDGTAMRGVSIRFRDLSSNALHQPPYTDSLFYRFLEHDLKSDGHKANIGVIWKLSAEDKADLLAFLKGL